MGTINCLTVWNFCFESNSKKSPPNSEQNTDMHISTRRELRAPGLVRALCLFSQSGTTTQWWAGKLQWPQHQTSSGDEVFELKTKAVQFLYIRNAWKLYYLVFYKGCFFSGSWGKASCRAPLMCCTSCWTWVFQHHSEVKTGQKKSQVLLQKARTEPNQPPSKLHQCCCHPLFIRNNECRHWNSTLVW